MSTYDISPYFFIGNESCEYVHQVSSDLTCAFVRNVTDCQFDTGFLQYFDFLYCSFSGSLVYLGLFIELLWCLVLLLVLAIVADEFFSPSLVVIAKFLRFSDNLAGVTLLALGNGAGDIFSAIAATSSAQSGDAGLMYGSIFGAGILVTTVTVGCVGLVKPFTAQRRPLVKDIIFYIISVVWNLIILLKGYIHFAEAICFIVLYIVYVIFTVASRTVRLRMLKKEKAESENPHDQDEFVKIKPTFKKNIHSDDFQSNRGVEMIGIKRIEGFDNPVYSADSLSEEKPTPVQEAEAPPAVVEIPHLEFTRPSRSSTPTKERSDTVTSIRPSYITRWVISHRRDDDALLQSELHIPSRPPLTRQRSRSHLGHGGHGGMSEPSYENRDPGTQFNSRRRASTIDVAMQQRAIVEEPSVSISIDDVRQDDRRENIQENGYDGRGRTISWGPTDYYKANAHVETSSDGHSEQMEEAYVVPGFFKHILVFMNPIDVDHWGEMSAISKTYEIIRSPLQFILLALVPRSNEDHPTRGWCKIVIMLQCFITPLFWIFAVEAYSIMLGPMPLWGLILIIGAILCVAVYFTSSYKEPPVYHWCIAMIGFATSILTIYTVINEVVNILQTFGVILQISSAIIALTFLAWANSVSDIMSNTILAKNNFPRIAIAACFAGPVFNVLLGLGIPFIMLSYNTDYIMELNVTTVQLLMMIFLLVALVLHMILLPVFKFRINRTYAIFWVIFYIVFVVVALLAEMNVIVIYE